MPQRKGAVTVGPISASSGERGSRVTADVDGLPVWFESANARLEPAPEAWLSAFLLPALHDRRALAFADPVDSTWLANSARLIEIFKDWWRYPILPVRATPRMREEQGAAASAASPHEARAAGAVPTPGVALFFSAGVDSFSSLYRGGTMPDRLVTVQGFDIPLDDARRMAALERSLEAVSGALGLRSIVLRTNLRSHPLVQAMAWERAHGGALAAAGHVLGEGVSEVLISSSIPRDRERSWGSHWMSDPLFSSSRVRFRQVGMEKRRVQKVRGIAEEPLVQAHLRVCWENRVAEGNCSRCNKCLITRMVLADCGALDRFPVFEGMATLARDIDALPAFRDRLNALTELTESPHLPPDVLRATRALLERSHHARSLPVRARRALLSQVMKLAGGGRS